MSFRVRVLLLISGVAVITSVATAWVILHQASRQVTESTTVDQAQLKLVKTRLLDYGARHGTWEGVPGLVRDLAARTGQRIQLASESGVVIVDTDTLDGRTARPVGSTSGFLDPRPQLTLPPGDPSAGKRTVEAIVRYRAEVRYAACLTRHHVDVVVTSRSLGVPYFAAAGWADPNQVADCRQVEDVSDTSSAEARVTACADAVRPTPPSSSPATSGALPTRSPAAPSTGTDPLVTCLTRAFTDAISDVAPVPAVVHLGSGDRPAVTLSTTPLLLGAAGVALVILVGTVLLSHRVLRPISTMTSAALRLGRGDLESRVTVRGQDELAELGRSFNRMADSLRRSEERQRLLIADVAHELRTPLSNLRGYLEALSDGVVSPSPELFASLHEEAVLQQRIVDDLQELALADAGNLAYHRTPVDLEELLETCRTAHRALAETAGVALTVHAEPGGIAERLVVDTDPDRLRQGLGNLITNALRATPPGGRVALHATRSEGAAVLQVVDTGSGIAPDALGHVFDRFWRADPARGRYSGGAGLGLAITRQFVTDLGGEITVASEVGVGTTFTVTLPLAR
jgi:two-component system sensor histidine kinase BaeS